MKYDLYAIYGDPVDKQFKYCCSGISDEDDLIAVRNTARQVFEMAPDCRFAIIEAEMQGKFRRFVLNRDGDMVYAAQMITK